MANRRLVSALLGVSLAIIAAAYLATSCGGQQEQRNGPPSFHALQQGVAGTATKAVGQDCSANGRTDCASGFCVKVEAISGKCGLPIALRMIVS
jgi:hypothetical protein